jgi:hypothetical protein
MDTDVRVTRQRTNAPLHLAQPDLRLRERLAIAALVTAVSSWIRAVEILPDNRHHL